MIREVQEYISRKGALQVLCEIDPHGSRFEEFVDAVTVSRPTLTNRLQEGQGISLLEVEAVHGERGTTHEYVLTPKGAVLRIWLDDMGMTRDYENMKRASKQFQRHVESTQDEIMRGSSISFEEENCKGSLSELRQRPRYTTESQE